MVEQLTETQWTHYEEEGFLRLGKLLDGDALGLLQNRIDAIMLGTAAVDYTRMLMQLDSDTGAYGDMPEMSKGHKGASLGYRKIQDLEFDPVFLDYMQRPIFRDICARVYGPDTAVACFRAMFMNKPARKGTELPWHQDRWADLDRDPLITVWTALDPATAANGCVRIIPGSHKLGLVNPGHGSGFLTAEQAAAHCKEEETVLVELEAGEVVLLHNWLIHSSGVNNTDIARRAFSVCYMDAGTISRRGDRYPVIFGAGALGSERPA